MSRFHFRIVAALSLAVLAATLLVGCTSSGDGGVAEANAFMNQGATFTSDSPPSATRVYFEQSLDERDRACFDVKAAAGNLYSVAFTVTYDPAFMDYTGYTLGELLGNESDLIFQVEERSAGKIVVGVSRSVAVTSDGVTGDGVLVSLCFRLLGPTAATRIDFDPAANTEAIDFAGSSVLSQWLGGSIEIQ